MAHEYECCAVSFCSFQAVITSFFYCLGCDGFCNSVLVINGSQKRSADLNLNKLVSIFINCCFQLIVFSAAHKVSRLDYEILNAVGNCTVKSLLHVVHLLAVTGIYMVDDDLCCESTSYGPLRICFLKCILNSLDVLNTAVIEAGTEGYYKEFVLTDLILISGIVLGSITGIIAEVTGICEFAFNQLFLLIGQGIPGCLCFFALCPGIFCIFLNIDSVDQVCNMLSCCKILVIDEFVHCLAGMLNINCLYIFDGSETFDLAVDGREASVCCELADPGFRILRICHIIVGMVACYNHQRTKNDLGIACCLNCCNDILAGSRLRETFYSTDEYVLVAKLINGILHQSVGYISGMACAMAHEYECSAVSFCSIQALIAGLLNCLSCDSFCNSGLILCCIQKRSCDLNLGEFALIS